MSASVGATPGSPRGSNSGDAEAPSSELPINELLSYRLGRVASALSRSAAQRYRRDFDVSIGEWRALALLDAGENLTVNRLARRANLDKAQMSRVLSGLVARGLVLRTAGAGRTSQLSLTSDGRRVCRGLLAAANERDRFLITHLTPKDRKALSGLLERLTELALELERHNSAEDECR